VIFLLFKPFTFIISKKIVNFRTFFGK